MSEKKKKEKEEQLRKQQVKYLDDKASFSP